MHLVSLAAILLVASTAQAATYYLSPAGTDHAEGRSEAAPWKTFDHAFSRMHAGDELILLDGVYSEAAGTGYLNFKGKHSAQVPSGKAASPTIVRAKNPGRVKIEGGLMIGRSFRKDSYITIAGLTFEGASGLYNSSFVTIKDCGFHDVSNSEGVVFGIGTNDHAQGNDHNLIEDCWIWGRNRIIAINYRSQYNVWRRVLVRGDGCNGSGCLGDSNPNVGITVYDSAHISLQNVIVVDRILDGGSPYADFAVAQHTPGMPYGDNEWLGTLSLNSPDFGYYMEPDETSFSPAQRFRNCVSWDARYGGINLARTGVNDIENCTVRAREFDGIRIAPGLESGTLRNVVVLGHGRFAVNSAVRPESATVSGTWESAYHQTGCTGRCESRDLQRDGSIKYVTRIESGSAPVGARRGAVLLERYGAEGSRHGEPGYNTIGHGRLWPWPNESRIQQEMCREPGITRGFCSKSSLTEYIWTYLGNPMPRDFPAVTSAR